jgi:hypothetical protein
VFATGQYSRFVTRDAKAIMVGDVDGEGRDVSQMRKLLHVGDEVWLPRPRSRPPQTREALFEASEGKEPIPF